MVKLEDIKKGLFITQTDYPDSFAIMADEVYSPVGSDLKQELLLCYYNPTHFEMDDKGKWKPSESIFSVECGDESCEYGIDHTDLDCWRICTEKEIENALKFLAEKRIKFNYANNELCKMLPHEVIRFNDGTEIRNNPSTQHGTPYDGQRRTYNNPYYQGQYPPSQRTQVNTTRTKLITRLVKDDWEQKTPITVMTVEHRTLLHEQCDKLKYSFTTSYNHGGAYGGCMMGAQHYGDYWDGDYYE